MLCVDRKMACGIKQFEFGFVVENLVQSWQLSKELR